MRIVTNMTSGKCPKISDTSSRSHDHTPARPSKVLAGIMMEQTSPPMARIVAAKVLLDRGWGKPKEMHHSEIDDNKTLKVVNEIVHVHETREQIGFRDQTPLLELTPEDTDDNGSKSTH
jgi:hypothetical protein